MRVEPGAIARAQAAFEQVAHRHGLRCRLARIDAGGVDEGVVGHQGIACAVQVDAEVIAMRHHVVGHHAVGQLHIAAAIAAEFLARRAAAQADAHPQARLRDAFGRADHQVALDARLLPGALDAHGVGGAVAAVLGGALDMVVGNLPAAGAHQIDQAHGQGGAPRHAVRQGAELQQPIIGPGTVLAVDLEVGVEVADAVVQDHGAAGAGNDVKGVLAVVVLRAGAAPIQVLEDPVRLIDHHCLQGRDHDLDAARLGRPQHDRLRRQPGVAGLQRLLQSIGAGRQLQHLSW